MTVSEPYSYSRERYDAEQAEPYTARRIAGELVPEWDVPTWDEL